MLHYAARAGVKTSVLEMLLAEVEQSEKRCGTSRHANSGNSKAASNVLNRCDSWGRTPLHWAVVNGHRVSVSWLLDAGADRKMRDRVNAELLV